MSTLSRRSLLVSAAAAPLAALPAAASHGRGFDPFFGGYFTVPDAGTALIGLLLPAVQRVRAAGRLLLMDAGGNVVASLPLPGGAPSLFELRLDRTSSPDGPLLHIQERGTGRTLQAPVPDGGLIALLLPAVQPDGTSAGLLAGSTQLIGPDGRVLGQLPFALGTSGASPGVAFAGPFTLAADEAPALIGLLLPAVQKVREAARMLLLNSAGAVLASEPLLPPPGDTSPFFGFQFSLAYGGETVRVEQIMGDGSVRFITNGVSPDGILIGLLLPAVQIEHTPVGVLGASVQVPASGGQDGANIVFTNGHSKWDF